MKLYFTKQVLCLGILIGLEYFSLKSMEIPKTDAEWEELTREKFNAIDPKMLEEAALPDYNIALARFNAKSTNSAGILAQSGKGSSILSRSESTLSESGSSIASESASENGSRIIFQSQELKPSEGVDKDELIKALENVPKQQRPEMTPEQYNQIDSELLTPPLPPAEDVLDDSTNDLEAILQEARSSSQSQEINNAPETEPIIAPEKWKKTATDGSDFPSTENLSNADQDNIYKEPPFMERIQTESNNDPEEEQSAVMQVLEFTAAALIAWTTTEIILAYKNTSQEEWDKAEHWYEKFDLVTFKTVDAMASRPKQVLSAAQGLLNKLQELSSFENPTQTSKKAKDSDFFKKLTQHSLLLYKRKNVESAAH